jgi:hypothetical protein
VRPFYWDGDQLVAEVSAAEAQALALVLTRVVGLIEHGDEDPGLKRLFPDGYRDDPEAAAELRELTEADLRESKIQNAHTILAALPPGGEIRVNGEDADTWLTALNDARLVLGEWIGITADTDLDEELALADPEGARAFLIVVQDLLSYLVESLATALTGS